MNRLRMSLLAASLAFGAQASSHAASDETVAALRLPVSVSRNTYAPGVAAAMHSHNVARFIYVASGGKLRVQSAAGEFREVEFVTGQGAFRGPERHALVNIGKTPLDFWEIDLVHATESRFLPEDQSNLGPLPDVPDTPDRRCLFRNRWGTLTWRRVGPGDEWQPARAGHDTLLLRLSRVEIKMIGADGTERHRTIQAGDQAWVSAGSSSGWMNEGRAEAVMLELSLEEPAVLFRPTVITGAPSGVDRR